MSVGVAEVRSELRRLTAAGPALAALGWRRRALLLGAVGRRFLDRTDPLRSAALDRLPGETGLSVPQCADVLARMAADWTAPRLEALVRAEFDDPDVLDRWVVDLRGPEPRHLRAFPIGPGVGVHVCAGTVPGVGVTSIVRGLLVGSPVLAKPGAGDRVLPSLFVDALREPRSDGAAEIAEACGVAYWRGGVDAEVERVALAGAGYLVAYGGDETVRRLASLRGPGIPLVDYGHRISVAVVLAGGDDGAAAACARAISAFDQRGCVSPQQVFVMGDYAGAEAFGDDLASELERIRASLPPGPLPASVATAIHQLRGEIELRCLAGEAVRLWAGDHLAWTVVAQGGSAFRGSPGGRTVHVTPVKGLDALESVLSPLGPYLQSVAVAGFDSVSAAQLSESVGRLGASRVVGLDDLAYPPAWWMHDGRGPLRRLVRWVERSYS